MTNKIHVRARFPDGQILTLNELDPTESYQALLSRFRIFRKWTADPRVLIAGHPPSLLIASPLQSLVEIIPSGTMLLIEPHPNEASLAPTQSDVSKARKREAKCRRALGRERAFTHVSGRKIDNKSGRTLGTITEKKVVTLSDRRLSSGSKRRRLEQDPDDIDQSDVDWAPPLGQEDDEDDQDDHDASCKRKRNQISLRNNQELTEICAEAPTTGRRGGQRARVARKNGPSSASGDGELVVTWTDTDAGDISAIAMEAGLSTAKGHLGAMLAASVFDTTGRTDNAISRELRAIFADALKKRQAEAEGERRLLAYLSKRYEIRRKAGGVKFTVRYGGTRKRLWTEENDGESFLCWPKVFLSAVLKEVVENPEDRLRLFPLDMATVSPRIFWNLVRLFPDGLEAGMRQLVPDADWSFLDYRTCTLPEKMTS